MISNRRERDKRCAEVPDLGFGGLRGLAVKSILIAVIATALAVFTETCMADEGMWLPYSLPDSLISYMQSRGCSLSQQDIFNSDGTGVANAVVSVGATGSFVSPLGLILTNHHVAFGAVQRISTPEHNYIEDGFLARTREEEVEAPGYIVYVLEESKDVTSRVLAAVKPGMDPFKRHEAIERAIKQIVSEAESGKNVYCEVNAFYGGARYRLDRYLKIPDVRVVYVPSRSIGEYGGDIDNWMWPRHTGDFSFLRAYVAPDGSPGKYSPNNVPYHPKSYLKINLQGLSEGDFSFIIGFPGRTHRYLSSYGLAYFEDFVYPERIRLYKQTLAILDEISSRDAVAKVRVASMVKAINNRLKNNQGMLDGFRRFDLVAYQKQREELLTKKFANDPERAAHLKRLLEEFASLYGERKRLGLKDLLLEQMLTRWTLLGQAMLLYKWSIERQKPDMERDPDFMNRRIPDLKRYLRVFQMGYHEASDKAILKMFLLELMKLPEPLQIDFLKQCFGDLEQPELGGAIDAFLDSLYAETQVDELTKRMAMFDQSQDQLLRAKDPFIDLAAQFYPENEERIKRDKSYDGKLSMIVPEWLNLISGSKLDKLYPDANGTMRLNCGIVKGYSPKDAVYYEPFTTLRGVVEKHTGVPPFNCPKRLLDAIASSNYDPYLSQDVGSVPVDFLTTHDSTGGNSGSPVLNANGELVGCLFDGNYEAMTSDFRFEPDLTRSISVDIRYILFIADHVDSAYNVLEELGLK